MLEAGGYPDFMEETFLADDRADLRAEDLERDLAFVSQVVGEIDNRHATTAELALDVVAISQRRPKAFEGFIHGFPRRSPLVLKGASSIPFDAPPRAVNVTRVGHQAGASCGALPTMRQASATRQPLRCTLRSFWMCPVRVVWGAVEAASHCALFMNLRRLRSTFGEACSRDCTSRYDATPSAKSAILAMSVAMILLAHLLLELRSFCELQALGA
jgi:hypothetical protein